MAQSLDEFGPFDAGAGSAISEDQWRRGVRHFVTDGPVRGEYSNFAVGTTAGRNVSVAAGSCHIAGQWGQRATAYTQAVATNTSGNPRIDRVILRNDFTANRIEIDILQGTPGASPAAPALTQNTSMWEISLAQLLLVSGYSAINAGDITDERAFAQGRPPGGPVLIACAATRGTNLPVASALNTAIQFDTSEAYDTASIHSLASFPGNFTIPAGCAGLWRIEAVATFETAVTGTVALVLYKNGSSFRTLYQVSNQIAGTVKVMSGVRTELCAVGDVFAIYVFQAGTGNAQNIISADCTLRYLGLVA